MMNKKLVAAAITFCLVLTINASNKPLELVDSNNKQGWKGMVKPNSEVKHSGDWAFELHGKYPTELISSKMIPIDMEKTYTLSAWMRSLDDKFPASAFFGLRMYDKDKKPITMRNTYVYPGTETSLARAAVKGSKELWLKKNPELLKRKVASIAFNAKRNYEDLPNFDVSPMLKDIVEEKDACKAVLVSPLKKSYPAGIAVRLHSPWATPFYWAAKGWIPTKWKKFSVTIKGEAKAGIPNNKFWKGTKYVRVFVWFGNYNRIPKKEARLLVDDIQFTSK